MFGVVLFNEIHYFLFQNPERDKFSRSRNAVSARTGKQSRQASVFVKMENEQQYVSENAENVSVNLEQVQQTTVHADFIEASDLLRSNISANQNMNTPVVKTEANLESEIAHNSQFTSDNSLFPMSGDSDGTLVNVSMESDVYTHDQCGEHTDTLEYTDASDFVRTTLTNPKVEPEEDEIILLSDESDNETQSEPRKSSVPCSTNRSSRTKNNLSRYCEPSALNIAQGKELIADAPGTSQG